MIDKSTSKRLLALDILRGITIAGMIMVNNPGSWSYMYAPLAHAPWNGLTPTDLVFPFFMFIMGISTYISLNKFNFEYTKSSIFKIIKRTIVIFLIGLVIAWLSLSFRTFYALEGEQLGAVSRFFKAITNFENLRIMGVMQRLSLTYCATSLIAVLVKHKYIPYIIVVTLIGYAVVLFLGHGFDFSEDNIISVIDRSVLGASHMYHDGGIALDPEGLISTIPAICHVLLGFYCASLFLGQKDKNTQMQTLFIIGTILTFSGFLLSYGCPINKKIWSPTFVLTTCGLAATFLALLIWIIDLKNKKLQFFEVFGINPLFMYVLGAVLTILMGSIRFYVGEQMYTTKSFIYNVLLQPYLGDYLGSLVFALLFICLNWSIGNILYKKKIYIKI